MKFEEFNNIIIQNRIGVSPVSEDTLLLARQVAQLEFTKALEIGTGTGFVPIYLTTLGYDCSGVDINPLAIECASNNARLNNLAMNFYVSNLFAEVEDHYDLLFFNPPHGNAGTKSNSKYLEIIKSLLPKENQLLLKVSYPFIKTERLQLLTRFLAEAPAYIRYPGKIVISLYDNEFEILRNHPYEALGKLGMLNLVLLSQVI